MPRLVRSVDFERVLRLRSGAATSHFAVHHLAARPTPVASARREPERSGLSTTRGITGACPVDDLPSDGPPGGDRWIGAVVPKRHARRAVTRSLIKRQIYAAAERHRDGLAVGLWVVRLRAPFDKTGFASAASEALKRCTRSELESLFAAAARFTQPAAS